MKRRGSILVLMILAVIISKAADPIIHLPDDREVIRIDEPLLLEDPTGELDLNVVQSPIYSNKFKKINPEQLRIAKEVDHFWLRFDIINAAGADGEWVFDFKRWSFVDFYFIDENGEVTVHKTGNFLPLSERDYAVSDEVWIKKKIQAGEKLKCFVHLQYDRTSSFVPTTHGFSIQTRTNALEANGNVNAVVYLFLGIFLVMFLYNLFVFAFTRDRNYFFYLLVVLSFASYTLNYSGVLYELLDFWESLPRHRAIYNSINNVLVGVGSLMFVGRFLDIRHRHPLWADVLKYLIIAVIAAPFARLFLEYEDARLVGNFVSLTFIVTIVVVIMISFAKKYPAASFLVVGVTVSAIGSFISVLAFMGFIPATHFTELHAMSLGACIEMVLFSFALAYRIKRLRRENRYKKEQLIAQLRENERLQYEINLELENKVENRTKEIRRQKELVEREKEKSDELLLNILPKSTAEELKKYGRAQPRYHEEATVMFTDFAGFTKHGRSMSVDEIHSRLDFCFQVFDHLSEEHKVEKIKTIGDSYMCVAGVPSSDPDHAYNMVMLGLQIRDFISNWNDDNERNGLPRWEVRIGIHSGPVISGVIGHKKLSFDIWGDTVNLASRMEKFGQIRKVNISEATYNLVYDKFQCESRGEISLRHAGEIEMYFADYLEYSDRSIAYSKRSKSSPFL